MAADPSAPLGGEGGGVPEDLLGLLQAINRKLNRLVRLQLEANRYFTNISAVLSRAATAAGTAARIERAARRQEEGIRRVADLEERAIVRLGRLEYALSRITAAISRISNVMGEIWRSSERSLAVLGDVFVASFGRFMEGSLLSIRVLYGGLVPFVQAIAETGARMLGPLTYVAGAMFGLLNLATAISFYIVEIVNMMTTIKSGVQTMVTTFGALMYGALEKLDRIVAGGRLLPAIRGLGARLREEFGLIRGALSLLPRALRLRYYRFMAQYAPEPFRTEYERLASALEARIRVSMSQLYRRALDILTGRGLVSDRLTRLTAEVRDRIRRMEGGVWDVVRLLFRVVFWTRLAAIGSWARNAASAIGNTIYRRLGVPFLAFLNFLRARVPMLFGVPGMAIGATLLATGVGYGLQRVIGRLYGGMEQYARAVSRAAEDWRRRSEESSNVVARSLYSVASAVARAGAWLARESEGLPPVVRQLAVLLATVVSGIAAIIGVLGDAAGFIADKVSGLVDALDLLHGAVSLATGVLWGALGGLSDSVRSAGSAVAAALQAVAGLVESGFGRVASVVNSVAGMLGSAVSRVAAFIGEVADRIGRIAGTVSAVAAAFTGLAGRVESVVGTVRAVAEGIAQAMEGLVRPVDLLRDIVYRVVDSLALFAEKLESVPLIGDLVERAVGRVLEELESELARSSVSRNLYRGP